MTQLNINVNFEELANAILESHLNTSRKSIDVTVLNDYIKIEKKQYVPVNFKQKNSESVSNKMAITNVAL